MSTLRTGLSLLLATIVAGCGGDTFETNESGTGGTLATGGATSSGGRDASGGGPAAGGAPSTGGAEQTGGGSSVDGSCDNSSQCILAGTSCCPLCRESELADYQAINVDQQQAHQAELCSDEDTLCPLCAEPPRNPHFFATCERGTCAAFDLREHEAAACSSDDECTLAPAACCACGAGNAPSDFVAIRRDSLSVYRESQCASSATSQCDDCEWLAPDTYIAVCANRVCTIESMQ